METLQTEPLTQQAFAAFGNVIETDGAAYSIINGGYTLRFNDLAKVDVGAESGHPLISIFRCQPRPHPVRLELLERHPLGSQAFIPLGDFIWYVVVAEYAHSDGTFKGLRAFRATGAQGVNYAPGVWHHPLLVQWTDSNFLVVDRGGSGCNLEEIKFTSSVTLQCGT